MPRGRRVILDDCVHHVINRGDRKRTLFFDAVDYADFIRLLATTAIEIPLRIVAFVLMRNHFHLALWPTCGKEVSAYMHRLESGHVQHFRKRWGGTGTGHVYQDRFKAFPVQNGVHLFRVLRYIEANPMRAKLVSRAEDWPWSSLTDHTDLGLTLTQPPTARPENWTAWVNGDATEESEALRISVATGIPYGTDDWTRETGSSIGSPRLRRGRPFNRERRANGLSPFVEKGDSPL